MRKFTKSFYDGCMENGQNEFIDLWDYELNKCTTKDIGYRSNIECWFKCPKGLHKSEEKLIKNLTCENTKLICNCCNSVGQWLIDNYGEDALDKYWDYQKNKNLDPFKISRGSHKKVWIKCDKGLHDSEEKMIKSLTCENTTLKCNSCNSIGQYLIDNYGENALEKYWDYEKNGNLNPFEIPRGSHKKVWIKCQENETHDSYFVRCYNFTLYGARCPICKESHGERKIRDYLIKNNIEFIPQKTFPKLVGIGNKQLSYDFHIPHKNLLIEFQGEQHYRPVDFSSKDMEQAEKKFEIQQEHDKRKREYAKQNNIDLLEISYLDEDKIEEILDKIFNKIFKNVLTP